MTHGQTCVLQGSLDLSPWLYVLPSELSPFKDLLQQVRAWWRGRGALVLAGWLVVCRACQGAQPMARDLAATAAVPATCAANTPAS